MTEFLPQLHDATLLSIQMDWSQRTCVLEFAGAPRIPNAFKLIFSEVSQLHVEARQSWGPSVSVLAAHQDGANSWRLTMQSGDSIRVEADTCVFIPFTPTHTLVA